jgi:polysaccharide export outer membrane protein
VLSVCILFAVTTALGSDAAKPVATSEAVEASSVKQGGKKTSSQPNAPSAKRVDDDYIIGPSDVLAITVWKDTELTRTVPVRPDGRISLPLIGELEVSGLTAPAVQQLVAEKLKVFISDPQVAVIVQEVKSRTYSVLGKIVKPGAYELGKPTTVLQAIAIAGGFLDFAKQSKVYIIRPVSGGSNQTLPFDYKRVIKGRNAGQNVELQNGDTIVVP